LLFASLQNEKLFVSPLKSETRYSLRGLGSERTVLNNTNGKGPAQQTKGKEREETLRFADGRAKTTEMVTALESHHQHRSGG
jgi:hypothetical protein